MKTPRELALDWIADNRVESIPQLVTSAFLAGYQAAAPQWISVKDRLPKEEQEVLIGWFQVTASNKQYFAHDVAIFNQNEFSGWRKYPEVTHWMPLPNPPKEEG
jgi:hypothetical protein